MLHAAALSTTPSLSCCGCPALLNSQPHCITYLCTCHVPAGMMQLCHRESVVQFVKEVSHRTHIVGPTAALPIAGPLERIIIPGRLRLPLPHPPITMHTSPLTTHHYLRAGV